MTIRIHPIPPTGRLTVGVTTYQLIDPSRGEMFSDEIPQRRELALFNGFLSGVSLDGARFFYENPLASSGHHHRQGWFECPCCPQNLARTLASLGGYFYSTGTNDILVHHYTRGTAKMQVKGHEVMRGPVVYCLEGTDHPGTILERITIDPRNVSNEFQVEQDDNLLRGVSVLRGKGTVVDESGWENILYCNKQPSSKSIDITAIPYYVWDNRAPGQMRIWIRARGD
jgi:DUF1680 family protein